MAKKDKEGVKSMEQKAAVAEKSTKQWMAMLKKHDHAVDYNNLKKAENVFQSPSPGINYLFGKKQGILPGYTALIYGPPKSGKSLFALAFAGQLHKDDPDAIVLHFDTEYRKTVDTWAKVFGIDMDRIQSYATNNPVEIFDFIANDVKAMLQQGAPIKMIIIDSLAMIQDPKEANKEVSTDFTIGGAAAYLGPAMKMIIPVIREFNVASIICQHVRMNMDPNKAKYYPYIIPGGTALKHSIEYWMFCQKIDSKDTKTFDSDARDGSGNPIQTGHMIRVKMEENSLGPQNRAVEVALSYKEGIVNQHVEIAELAKNMGIVERPTNSSYVFENQKWVGADNFALAIKADEELKNKLIEKIKENDIT
jgi:RecA/RadA recombinase